MPGGSPNFFWICLLLQYRRHLPRCPLPPKCQVTNSCDPMSCMLSGLLLVNLSHLISHVTVNKNLTIFGTEKQQDKSQR